MCALHLNIMLDIKENIPLKNYTTLGIGGPAKYFVEVQSIEGLKTALQYAKENTVPYYILAGGSDLLISDKGFNGLVIKYSDVGAKRDKNKVMVRAGTLLQDLVDLLNEAGLKGIEKLAGIPGTVGGAIYGNAGAYGVTISDKLARVRVFDGKRDFWMNKDRCNFNYRHSTFKERKDYVILEVEFEFDTGNPQELKKISADTIKTRSKKYPPGIKCPGSFFKNMLLSELPQEVVNTAPKDYYGKLPAGWLLEQVGAKGASKGKIKIADYHANLFINEGGGKAQDFFDLASKWKQKVKQKFGIELEPEVQLVGFQKEL